MIETEQPDYVVERPHYLWSNETVNTGVPMFRTPQERRAFFAAYEPLSRWITDAVPARLRQNYHFVVYRRRGPARWAAEKAAGDAG